MTLVNPQSRHALPGESGSCHLSPGFLFLMTAQEHNRFPNGRWTVPVRSLDKELEKLARIERTLSETKFALDVLLARSVAEDCVWLGAGVRDMLDRLSKIQFRLDRQREFEQAISNESTTPGPLGD